MSARTGIAEAADAVRAARRRLVVAHAADRAALGALGGAAVGGAAWLVGRWTGWDVGVWPLLAPVVGAAGGAIEAAARGVAFDRAASALDAAAGTDEAFVSSLTPSSGDESMRALVADQAVAKCPRSAVSRFLPVRAPVAATAAAVATALVAALVLVPRATTTQDEVRAADGRVVETVAGAASPTADASPRARVERLRDAVEKRATQDAASLAPAVRRDLGAVTDADMRRLAEALVAAPTSADAAKRALAALDRGDRAAATAALTEALGGERSVATSDGTGAGTAAAPGAATSPSSWSGASWPLRYDGVVRRWMEQGGTAR